MIARLFLAFALIFAGVVPAGAQATISSLPQVATPTDADLFPLDVQSYPLSQRTHSVSALGLAQYILGRIPLGPQGVPGQVGPAGPANSLSVGTVAASAPGANPTVTVTGTAPAQTLSFTLPRGAAGPQGTTGATGPAGATGPQGAQGPTGAVGPANQLSIGTVTASDPGSAAYALIGGSAPNQSLSLVLPRGIQGPIGPTGPTGNGQGNVLGPSGSVATGDVATFTDTTGTRLSDGGALGPAATKPLAFFLQSANNLSDLGSVSTARANLGLGGAALLNVGTAAGTVAAGNDGRITGALQAANNLSDVATPATARTNLGLGSAAVQPSSYFLQAGNNLSDLASAAAARSNLGLGSMATQAANAVAITGGTADGVTIGGSNSAAGSFTTLNASNNATAANFLATNSLNPGALGQYYKGLGIMGTTAGSGTPIFGVLNSSENATGGPLVAWDNDKLTSKKNTLDDGAGNMAVAGAVTLGTPLAPAQGGTGVTTAAAELSRIGAAPLASPALTGTPTAPTATAGDASGQIATDKFVSSAIAAIPPPSGGGAPSAVNALSSAYTVQASDKGKTLLLTGSFTVTEPACSSNSGLYFWVRKADGNGVVALTPASGTTDGLASKSVYQESFLEWCDGTNWRSQGRPKGWVDIGTTTVSSAVASVSFTTGFADPELRDMMFDAEALSFASLDLMTLRFTKSGTVQPTGYTYANTTSSSSGAAGAGVNSGSSIQTAGANSTGPIGLDATIWGFGAATGSQRVTGTVSGSNLISNFSGMQTTVSAAVTGITFVPNGGNNISAGAIFNQRGFRP